MHEMAITQSIIDAVRERLGDTPIRALTIEVGALSGVVSEAIRFCFDLAAEDTPLAGAQLEIAEPPGLARCHDCAAEFETRDLFALCRCGGGAEILSGQELRIRSVEVR